MEMLFEWYPIGLFRAAIGQSGSALNPASFNREAIETAYGIAAEIDPGFGKNCSSQELLEILCNADSEMIHATTTKYKSFAPVIEVMHEGAMITESMYTSVEQGKFNRIPYLAGITSEEAVRLASGWLPTGEKIQMRKNKKLKRQDQTLGKPTVDILFRGLVNLPEDILALDPPYQSFKYFLTQDIIINDQTNLFSIQTRPKKPAHITDDGGMRVNVNYTPP
ncbi:hypothetical protein JTB14_017000 [Gonioctena quinquepunctata]|nr:hypothetical protein JTB14_017000 [Gonioctena quinquepunctata]